MAHKVGDTVTVKRGPHKGDAHKVIHVHKDGRVNVKPHNKMPHQIKYRHGAATASANDVTKMKEDVGIAEITDEEEYAMIRKIQNHHKLRARQADAMNKRKAIKTKKKAAAAAASRAGMNKPDGQFIRRKESTNEESMLTFEAHSWSHDSGWKKPQAQRKDKFGNVVKDKNVAKNLARKAMKKTKDDEKKQVDEIARSMTPMRDKFGKSKAEKEADREKLQKIQKMLKRDKAVAKKSTHPGPNEDVDEACWDSHKQVGMKKKGGKMVPNCVPKNENQNAALQKKLSKSAQSSEKGKAAVTLKKAPFKIPSKNDMNNEGGMKRMSTGDGMDTFKKKPSVKKEVLDKDKDHMSYRNKAKTSMDRARNSATAKIVRGDDGVDREKNTMRKRAAGMAMSDRKGVRQFRKFHGYDKKK